MKYYLLLGSNIGNSKSYIEKAKFMLAQVVGSDCNESAMYRTEPWGEKDQKFFLNQVVKMESELSPHSMMQAIEKIEKLLGKRKETRYGPRTIDIDILLCDDLIVLDKKLSVPHPRMHKRAFTLIPLNVIAEDIVHPVLKKTIGKLLEECVDNSEVIKVQ